MDSNEYRTPPEIFGPLYEEFHFALDVAATKANALVRQHPTYECSYIGPWGNTWRLATWGEQCPRCGSRVGNYFTAETDALSKDWGRRAAWCNPPYSAPIVSKFVAKCAEHAKAGGLAVMLLNASTTDTRWFHKHIWDAKMHRPRERVEVRFLPKRICFLDEAGVPQKSPRYSNMVVVFHPWEVS